MLRTAGLMSIALLTAGCSMFGGAQETPVPASEPELAPASSPAPRESSAPPQLWSGHKELELKIAVCADRAFNTLQALGYTDVVKNGDFSYGNLNGNRAAVKCVAGFGKGVGKSFVYFAVAGPDKDMVEKLRNDISRRL